MNGYAVLDCVPKGVLKNVLKKQLIKPVAALAKACYSYKAEFSESARASMKAVYVSFKTVNVLLRKWTNRNIYWNWGTTACADSCCA